MPQASRLLLSLVSVTCFALTLALIMQNRAPAVDVQFLGWALPGVSLGLAVASGAVLAGAGVMLNMLNVLQRAGVQKRQASRELERRDISKEEAEAKVKVLETKVQTLEKALQEALKSGQTH